MVFIALLKIDSEATEDGDDEEEYEEDMSNPSAPLFASKKDSGGTHLSNNCREQHEERAVSLPPPAPAHFNDIT